jgi:hypothetical protein
MTDQEWLAYQDKLAALDRPTGADIADCLGALLERISTIIVAYANRQHDDTQHLARRLDDLHTRLDALSGAAREVGGDGDT